MLSKNNVVTHNDPGALTKNLSFVICNLYGISTIWKNLTFKKLQLVAKVLSTPLSPY